MNDIYKFIKRLNKWMENIWKLLNRIAYLE